jgi:hypothetical protein
LFFISFILLLAFFFNHGVNLVSGGLLLLHFVHLIAGHNRDVHEVATVMPTIQINSKATFQRCNLMKLLKPEKTKSSLLVCTVHIRKHCTVSGQGALRPVLLDCGHEIETRAAKFCDLLLRTKRQRRLRKQPVLGAMRSECLPSCFMGIDHGSARAATSLTTQALSSVTKKARAVYKCNRYCMRHSHYVCHLVLAA